MRPENAATIAFSIFSKPCSENSAPSAASSSAARTLRLRTSRLSSSSASAFEPRSRSRRPRSSSRATTAQLWRDTTCERIFARRPSEKSGWSSKSVRSGAHDEWVKTRSARRFGSSSISRASCRELPFAPRLLVRRDVIDCLADRRDLLGVLVGDLDPELVLELHDQLDQIERVGIEVLLERCLRGDLALVHAELLGQDILHTFVHFLAGRCHLTSPRGGRT